MDIQLQDFKGNFHLLQQDQIAAIDEEKGSPMPPVKASPEELQDLVAYLGGLTGVKAGIHPVAGLSDTAGIDFARIENPKPGEWPTYNGTLNANRYSDLTQINTNTVSKLGLKWVFTIPVWKWFLPDTPYYHEKMKDFAVEVTPLVVDGVMYVTGPNSVYALDALTGREIWAYTRPRTPGVFSDSSLGTNRGVAVLGDKVFRMTDNAHLIALNRTTGSLVWEVVMTDEPEHYGSTLAPLIVKDMVVAGVSGSDWGIRGFVAAYKASTGERVWRFWTIPAKGEPGIETWKGKEPTFGGGGTWSTGSYDSETDTLYWSTATPWPDSDDRDRPGDNLFTDSVLAFDPANGKLKWHYQFTPHDTHAYDATEPDVLVDTRYQGQDRKLLLHADRNGFFYVFDRTNGQILLATKFISRVTWASGIDPDGRPRLLPDEGITCPISATNWNATAFSPVTRLYYVMADEKCEVRFSQREQKTAKAPDEPGKKYLRALDIETGKRVWEIPQIRSGEGNRLGGLLATAGGIMVYGNEIGDVVAVDERDGKRLWHFTTNGLNQASPMTYSVGGRQFIALAVGPNIMCFGLP
jgi:PQQ-dependent dehydrogenase (methanol/ethanol family)